MPRRRTSQMPERCSGAENIFFSVYIVICRGQNVFLFSLIYTFKSLEAEKDFVILCPGEECQQGISKYNKDLKSAFIYDTKKFQIESISWNVMKILQLWRKNFIFTVIQISVILLFNSR